MPRADGQPVVPVVNFHSLRHLQASHMLAAGVPLAVVSKRLGHSSVQFTSDRYGHLLEGVGAHAAAAAANLIPTVIRSDSPASGLKLGVAGSVDLSDSPAITGETGSRADGT